MNGYQDVQVDEEDGWFLRAGAAVGDFGNPFYRDERQRDVWNEASAVGLQLMLWLGLAAASAMVWLGGDTAWPYAVVLVAVLGAGSWVSMLYARALGVHVTDARRVLRLRLIPYLVLLLLFVVGSLRAAPADGSRAGFAVGAAVGGAVAVLWLAWSGLRARHAQRDGEVEQG